MIEECLRVFILSVQLQLDGYCRSHGTQKRSTSTAMSDIENKNASGAFAMFEY
jgi:hypothetical protein